MVLIDLPLWILEGTTILCSRNACGDESTLDIGECVLSTDAQERLAERHPSQVASMLETRALADSD